MGSNHARSILSGKVPGLRLVAVSDQNPERGSQFPELTFFTDPLELIASEDIDAVIVATPHYDHTSLGMLVLQSGKHLLMEKPISVHKADCERLIDSHTDKDVVFAAMFNQRMDPRYVKLKALLDSGELGRINRIHWTITDWFRTDSYYRSGGWRATWAGEGGGVLLNQCPHQLDLWQWMFGMPSSLRAFCSIGRFHDIEVEDDVTCYMEYANGCKGVFITTTGEAPGSNRLEIACERGRLIIDAETDGITWVRNEIPASEYCRTAKGGFSKPSVWKVQVPTEAGWGPQHVGIMNNFADAILNGATLVAPAAEGIHSVELANAMLMSSHLGQTLQLPIDGEAYEQLLKGWIAGSQEKKLKGEDRLATDFDHA